MPEIIAFFLGTLIGSFMNVCIVRLPAGESVVLPASHCRSCKKAIAWYDNVPLLSFLRLKGRCRYCKARFSAEYFLVELAAGALFVVFYKFFGLTVPGVVYLVFSLAIVVESVIDFHHRIIPDQITLPGMGLALGVSLAFPSLHGQSTVWGALVQSGLGLVLGGGVLLLMGIVGEWLFKKEAMGGGDVKLLAMIGALLGWPGVLWTLFAGSLLGSIIGIYLRLRHGAETIPFGPYLGLAAFLYLFFGKPFFIWYGTLLGL